MNPIFERKFKDVEINGITIRLYDRDASDYFEYFEEFNAIRKDQADGADGTDVMLRLNLLHCKAISQSVKVYYNSLKWYQLIKKFKIVKFLKPTIIFNENPTEAIVNLSNIVLELDGIDVKQQHDIKKKDDKKKADS